MEGPTGGGEEWRRPEFCPVADGEEGWLGFHMGSSIDEATAARREEGW
jgi:hypothetical protein